MIDVNQAGLDVNIVCKVILMKSIGIIQDRSGNNSRWIWGEVLG